MNVVSRVEIECELSYYSRLQTLSSEISSDSEQIIASSVNPTDQDDSEMGIKLASYGEPYEDEQNVQ